jgi:hypothetical protein
MTLHDRLEAAINERLAVAQAAGGQSWKTSMISLYMNGNEDGAIRPMWSPTTRPASICIEIADLAADAYAITIEES